MHWSGLLDKRSAFFWHHSFVNRVSSLPSLWSPQTNSLSSSYKGLKSMSGWPRTTCQDKHRKYRPYTVRECAGISVRFISHFLCFSCRYWAEDTHKDPRFLAEAPNLLGTGDSVMEDNFFTGVGGWGGIGVIHLHYIDVHFIFIIITSVPPQIIRHQIPELGFPVKTWCVSYQGCKQNYDHTRVCLVASRSLLRAGSVGLFHMLLCFQCMPKVRASFLIGNCSTFTQNNWSR